MPLLTTNTKLSKGDRFNVIGLAMAPHVKSGVNFCENAGFCVKVCNLWYAGRTVTSTVRNAMLARSKLFNTDRVAFLLQLDKELAKFARKCDKDGKQGLVRLNVASDIDWRDTIVTYPQFQFYDYTKHAERLADLPSNYQLTYSWSEKTTAKDASAILERGQNIAVVFDTEYLPQLGQIGPLPSYFQVGEDYWPVVDGDKHDYRLQEIDGSGVIIGLRFKGLRRFLTESIARGFTQHDRVLM